MNFADTRIGYWPYEASLNMPGDRRRFVFYAEEKKLDYEIANITKRYKVIYLTMGCNISEWLDYKKKYPETKLIFEIVDSYFLQRPNLVTRFKGLVRFIIGKESRLYINYQTAILSIIKKADVVVCSSATQKDFLSKYNKNVHISLDFFLNDITHIKNDFGVEGKLKLVWEGQAYTVHNLLEIKKVFKRLADKVELHIITDPTIIYPFKIFNKKTSSILSKILCDQYFYKWEKESFSKLIAEADLAIIPIGRKDELDWNKPENKLLLFWQIGIPVLTSPTPSYAKAMNKAGLPCLCNSYEEWVNKIEEYITMTSEQREVWHLQSKMYLKNNHSKELIMQNWDNIFLSINKGG